MVKTKLVKAAGRYGARYGQRIKRKIASIEAKQRKKQYCPFCGKRAKRLSKGIWKCKKCKKKFAAHAYYLEKDSVPVKKELKSKPLKETKPLTKKKEKKTEKKETKKQSSKTKKTTKTKKKSK